MTTPKHRKEAVKMSSAFNRAIPYGTKGEILQTKPNWPGPPDYRVRWENGAVSWVGGYHVNRISWSERTGS